MLLEKITIGNSIESLFYAFINDNYFLPTASLTPVFYEEMTTALLGEKRTDYNWSRLQIVMSLSGRLLNYTGLKKIKITDNEIKISSLEGLQKYKFGTCNVFDTTKVELENNISESNEVLYKVFDDFEISNLGGKHTNLPPKISEDQLARKIYYYTSDRVDGAHYVTDCVSESLLSQEQISDVNYSDSMARFAIIRHLTSIGIYGNFMKLYKNGTRKYRKPKVIHKKRIVIKQEMSKYQNSHNVKFLNLSIEEMLNDQST